jgi:hypothetical protein
MLELEADADLPAERMVVVAGHQRQELRAAVQAQGVEDLGAAEGLVQDRGLHRAGVVVHHVVRAQQHLHRAGRRGRTVARRHLAQLDADAAIRQPLARHQCALTDEVGDEAVGRAVVEVVGAVPLPQPAFAEHADAVGHGEGLVLRVRDQERGHAFVLQDAPHLLRQALAQIEVEAGEGLVEQQQAGFGRQRARQRHALLLAAGQLMRIGAPFMRTQADQRQHCARAFAALAPRQPVQAELHVVERGQVRQQRQVLEHHADAARFRRQACAGGGQQALVAEDAAGQHRLEAGDGAQQRGLARAGGAQQAGDLAARDGEADVRDQRPAAMPDAHALKPQLHDPPPGSAATPAAGRRSRCPAPARRRARARPRWSARTRASPAYPSRTAGS